jgi:hypothetical protein
LASDRACATTPAEAFHRFDAAFARAAQRQLALWHFAFAGRVARMRVAGAELAKSLARPFAHLRLDQPGQQPSLTLDLWDEAATGVRCETAGFGDGQASADGRHVVHTRLRTTTVLDRGGHRLVGRVCDAAALSLHERGRPLFTPLMLWLQDRHVQPVHAGLVARDGQGILFGGPGGSGKSSVSLGCLADGFDFLSDDYVGLEQRAEGFVGHSVFCSIHLDEIDLRRFPALVPHALLPTLPGEDKPLVLLSDLCDRGLARSAAIRAVTLPRVTGVPSPRLRPAKRAEALLRLAPSSLLLLPYAQTGLRALAALIEEVPVFWLELGDGREKIPGVVADLLREVT